MAEQIGNNYYLKLDNGGTVTNVDLSAFIEEMTINYDPSLVEFTTSTNTTLPFKRRLGGVVDFSIMVKFSDDFAAGSVDSVFRKLVGTSFTVVAALNSSTPSTSNLVWTDIMVFDKLPAGGAVGAHLEKTITFYHASGVPTPATS